MRCFRESGYKVLLSHDFATYCNFEEEFQKENIVGQGEIYHIYLNKLLQAGKIDQLTFNELLKNNRHRLKRITQTVDAEVQLLREEILDSKDLEEIKNVGLNNLPVKYNSRLVSTIFKFVTFFEHICFQLKCFAFCLRPYTAWSVR